MLEVSQMSARTRRGARASLLGALAILALAASPVLAKEGAVAKLDTAVHRDAQPGSTIEVRWSITQIQNDAQYPLHAPTVVDLVGPRGASTQAAGVETPAGSGHYTASIKVPDGGIWSVAVSVRGQACYGVDVCQTAAYDFPLTDDALVSGQPVGFSTPATPAAPVSPVGEALLPLVVVGIAFALGGGLAALLVSRRRQVGAQPTGR